MPKRFTDGYFALVLVVLIGLFAVANAAFLVLYSKGYQSADEQHQAAHANYSEREAHYQKCLEREASIDAARECVDSAPNASRKTERAEYDLNAQRQMAHWAEGMLWATSTVGFCTVFVTGLGAWWVRQTLMETRRIGEAQVRAYLTFDQITILPNATSTGVQWLVDCKYRNSGNSPMRSILIGGQAFNAEFTEVIAEDLASNGVGRKALTAFTPIEDVKFAPGSETDAIFWCIVTFRFRDVFQRDGEVTTYNAMAFGNVHIGSRQPIELGNVQVKIESTSKED